MRNLNRAYWEQHEELEEEKARSNDMAQVLTAAICSLQQCEESGLLSPNLLMQCRETSLRFQRYNDRWTKSITRSG